MSLRTQIWLLLGIVVLAAFVVAAGVMAQQTLAGGSRQVAEWIDFAAQQADGARAADYRQHQDGRSPLLMTRRTLPPDEPTVLPLAQAVMADLRDWRGADNVRLESGIRPIIWIRSHRDPDLWTGVPLQTLRGNIARATWWILLVSAILILLGGAWFSNRITRSLSALADAAPTLVHGDRRLADLASGTREVQALAQALDAAAASVHRHYHARESWLTGFSHDLRTPIARLKFALELEPVALRHRAEIDANLDEIDRLLTAFLDLQRHGLDEPVSTVDLVLLVDTLVRRFTMYGPIAWQPPSTPLCLEGRPLCLERAITNLLKNAFDHGSQPISVRIERRDGEILLTVTNALRDTGPTVPGFGMGLAVARTMASLHGGRFTLIHDAGRAEATLVLPLGVAAGVPTAA